MVTLNTKVSRQVFSSFMVSQKQQERMLSYLHKHVVANGAKSSWPFQEIVNFGLHFPVKQKEEEKRL